MDYTKLTVTREGAVARVALNRPDVRNAFDDGLIAELSAAFRELGGDDSVRAIVLAGAGKVFCAGADIGWMRSSVDMSVDENREDTLRLAGMLRDIDENPHPVIGAVHGAALGGACGLVAACDIVIAAEGTKFGFTEVRLGIVPAAISTFVLPKIGERYGRRYFLTGEIFAAVDAKEIGLVHEVVPPGELHAAAESMAGAIVANGPRAVAEAKTLVREMKGRTRDESIPYTAGLIARVRTSPEGQEGLRAFLEKRKPSWIEESEKR